MIMAAIDLVTHRPGLDRHAVREGLEGNLCRCTGYHNIVDAVLAAAPAVKAARGHGHG
jgi:carbon-monoxide dehydrogenase small subunit